MKKFHCKPFCFILIAIILLLLHFGLVAYIHTKYVHVDASFWEHFLSIKHLTIDEKLNRLFTVSIVLFFAVIATVLYSKLHQYNEKVLKIHNELEEKYKNLLTTLNSQFSFFSRLLDNSPVAIFVIDKHHKVLFWNRACENLTGIKREEVLGTDTHWKGFSQEKRPLLADLVLMKNIHNYSQFYDKVDKSSLIDNGFYAEKYFENLGGKERYIMFEVAPIYNEKGEIEAVVQTLQDITEIKKMEKELIEREEIFNKLANSTSAAIFMYDETGFKYGNKMCETLGGYKLEELLKMSFYDVVHPDMKEVAKERGIKRLSGEKIENRYDMKIVTKSGEVKWVDFTSDIIEFKGKKIAIGTAYDITEKKKLEETLIHSQKMEAIGRLAAGIAHDFNNILTGIIGFASLIEMNAHNNEDIKKQAKNILLASERAADLTRALLAFSRKQIFSLRSCDINELLNSFYKIIKRIIGEDIELKLFLCEEKIVSKVDPAQIESAILNLVTNARDAMPGGGILTIETYLFKPDKIFKQKYSYENGDMFCVIAVSDTGVGIPDSIKEKIFEPFFTTKEVGRGTGLGLASVYGIVKQHKGYINVYSEVGRGTTFKIYLPLTTEEPVTNVYNAEDHVKYTGKECILLVEDEEIVRKINKETLELFGYTVIEAKDGSEALNIYVSNHNKIDLVILDVVMPKMDGKEAYENMKKINTDVKVLFMSGYTENLIHSKGVLAEGINFISKPVTPTELAKKVRFVLDNR